MRVWEKLSWFLLIVKNAEVTVSDISDIWQKGKGNENTMKAMFAIRSHKKCCENLRLIFSCMSRLM